MVHHFLGFLTNPPHSNAGRLKFCTWVVTTNYVRNTSIDGRDSIGRMSAPSFFAFGTTRKNRGRGFGQNITPNLFFTALRGLALTLLPQRTILWSLTGVKEQIEIGAFF